MTEAAAPETVRFVDLDLPQQAAHVARMIVLKASQAFAPWRLGFARPFFVPKWVPSFERAHRGWRYEHELFVGFGKLYFPQFAGSWLAAQFVNWTRQDRGGKLEEGEVDGQVFLRFTPDRDRDDWRNRLIPAPRQRIVRPAALARADVQLVVPGRRAQ